MTQPGVWAVECLNVDNGRLNWRQPLPEITTLAGRIDQRLIVGTTDGLLALDTQNRQSPLAVRHCPSGSIRSCAASRAAFSACGGKRPARRRPARPVLVWVAPDSGKVVAECAIELPSEGASLCGPIIARGDRQWAIFTVPERPDVREIVELVVAKDGGKAALQ